MERLRRAVQDASMDQLKACAAIALSSTAILSIVIAAALPDWSKWCQPANHSICEETGLWEECSDNFSHQYLCTDTSGTQYGAVRAFTVLSVPAALACIYMAYKVAKDPLEIDYFRFLWYAVSISETLFGAVGMTLYMSITIAAGEPHIRYGPGFGFLVLAWILAVGNVLCCASIGPGGLRGVCGRRVRRGQDLLTEDERAEDGSGRLSPHSPPMTPPGARDNSRQLSISVEMDRAPSGMSMLLRSPSSLQAVAESKK